jgi:hypothetical protein
MTDIAATPNSVQAPGSAMDLVLRAARDGASDASEAAAKFWSQAGTVLSRAVYVTAYTISYGVVFPVALVARSVPQDNAAVRGLIEGAHAAGQKVDAILGRSLEAPAAT